MVNFWFRCSKPCGEVLAIDLETTKVCEVDVKNNRVTSVEHTIKRCNELVRCRSGKKPLPVGQLTFDQIQ